MRLGERQESLTLLAMGHQMMATNFFCLGRFRRALESIERALACVRSGLEQNWNLTVAGQFTRSPAALLAFAAIILSASGRLEQARRYGREALEQARRIGHPHTTALVLTYTAMACQVRREVQEASRCAEEAVAHLRRAQLLAVAGVGESHPGLDPGRAGAAARGAGAHPAGDRTLAGTWEPDS